MKRLNNLFVLIGCPGSGKSTWAAKQKERQPQLYNIISRDDIRLNMLKDEEDYWAHEHEVYNEFINKIGRSLRNPTIISTIADASHLNVASRTKLLRHLNTNFPDLDYDIVYVWFDTPLEVCKERNSKRSGRRCVPEAVVENMYFQMRFPTNESDKLKRIEIVRSNA